MKIRMNDVPQNGGELRVWFCVVTEDMYKAFSTKCCIPKGVCMQDTKNHLELLHYEVQSKEYILCWKKLLLFVITVSRALSKMADQGVRYPSSLILVCVLRIYMQFHLAYIVFCSRDLTVQAFFMPDNENDLYTNIFHLECFKYLYPQPQYSCWPEPI